MADRLAQRWGQPVVVENRPGGDGIVAINAFVGAHDDHVLLFSPTSSFTAHPYLHDHLPYKASDLVPITRVSNTIVAISVPSSLNVDTLDKLVALIRAQPGKLNWAGVTGALDFMFAGWLQAAKDLNIDKGGLQEPRRCGQRPRRGPRAGLRSGLANRAAAAPDRQDQAACRDQYRARAEPSPIFRRSKEAGQPALTIDGLVGLFGPTGMPLELRQRITADIRAVADDTIKDRLITSGPDSECRRAGGICQIDRRAAGPESRQFAKELGVAPLPQD